MSSTKEYKEDPTRPGYKCQEFKQISPTRPVRSSLIVNDSDIERRSIKFANPKLMLNLKNMCSTSSKKTASKESAPQLIR
jgi:hypothetical protein